MNWLPIKHALIVNRTKAGTFSLRLRPSNHTRNNGYSADGEGATFQEALSHIENKVKAIRVKRGEG